MPLPPIEPIGYNIAGASTIGVEFHISGLELSCTTCGDGGLVVATHTGWVISCRNGHNYTPTPETLIVISPEEET